MYYSAAVIFKINYLLYPIVLIVQSYQTLILQEEEAATGKVIEEAIKSALETARSSHVTGKDMTPFLLGEVNRLTSGLSLKANKRLIENNVWSACGIATHLAQLRSKDQEQSKE